MKKTDNRHINNVRANRNLHTELDLWIAYKNNNEQPLLLGTATSKGNLHDAIWTLFYAPSDIAKTTPYLLKYKCGSDYDSCRFETISSAKYYLKKNDSSAKWKTQNK